MKQLITICLLFSLGSSFAQKKIEVPQEVIEAIKNDVWIPFMEAYATLDSKKLKSVHSKDILRITIDQNQITSGEPYLEGFGGFLDRLKEENGKLKISFAILSTAIDETGNMVYQTGYYGFSSKKNEHDTLTFRGYGHFSVGLRKEQGQWKIWLDSDKRIELSHEEFNDQKIVYEFLDGS